MICVQANYFSVDEDEGRMALLHTIGKYFQLQAVENNEEPVENNNIKIIKMLSHFIKNFLKLERRYLTTGLKLLSYKMYHTFLDDNYIGLFSQCLKIFDKVFFTHSWDIVN